MAQMQPLTMRFFFCARLNREKRNFKLCKTLFAFLVFTKTKCKQRRRKEKLHLMGILYDIMGSDRNWKGLLMYNSNLRVMTQKRGLCNEFCAQ